MVFSAFIMQKRNPIGNCEKTFAKNRSNQCKCPPTSQMWGLSWKPCSCVWEFNVGSSSTRFEWRFGPTCQLYATESTNVKTEKEKQRQPRPLFRNKLTSSTSQLVRYAIKWRVTKPHYWKEDSSNASRAIPATLMCVPAVAVFSNHLYLLVKLFLKPNAAFRHTKAVITRQESFVSTRECVEAFYDHPGHFNFICTKRSPLRSNESEFSQFSSCNTQTVFLYQQLCFLRDKSGTLWIQSRE